MGSNNSHGPLSGSAKKLTSKIEADSASDTEDGKGDFSENYSTRRMPLTSAGLAVRLLAPTVPKGEELEYRR